MNQKFFFFFLGGGVGVVGGGWLEIIMRHGERAYGMPRLVVL